MKSSPRFSTLVRVASIVLGLCTLYRTAEAEEIEPHRIGVGYKIGNGLGFEGGDVVLHALPHVSFDLQLNYLSSKDTLADGSSTSFSGVGLAPAVQWQLRPLGHTPYLSVGVLYVRFSAHHDAESATGSGTGFFANAGYEWRFASGLGVLVGGGISDLLTLQGSSDTTSFYSTPDKVFFNLEAGVRYFF